MSAYDHTPGKPLECLSLAIELTKDVVEDCHGQVTYVVGFKIGGGIDQDPTKSPFNYLDNGIYVTYVEPGSPADRAGLRQHDKILQVNGKDFTMVTHDKAVKYIKRDPVLQILLTRPEMSSVV